MREIVAIARNTFKEAIRNRILYIILIFALMLIAFSGVVSTLAIAEQLKVIKNLGFMAISALGVATAVFVGVSLVYNEIEKKSIYTIVSKPIGRGQFLLGKYLGLLATVWVNVALMGYCFLVSLHYYHGRQAEGSFLGVLLSSFGRGFVDIFLWNGHEATRNIMPVLAIICLELALVTAFSVMYSAFSTPTLSMFFTVLTFIAGRLSESIIKFADQVWNNARTAAGNGPMELPVSYYFATVASYVVPNLQAFSKTVVQAIYDPQIQIWPGTILYGIFYTFGILALAVLIFQQRNFK